MKGASESNSARQYFISIEVAEKVSEACPGVLENWYCSHIRLRSFCSHCKPLIVFACTTSEDLTDVPKQPNSILER